MNDVHNESCAVAATADLIGSKWTPVIVHDLSEGPRRFTQLEHACPGISPRTLSERLQMLEHEGIVVRRSYAESPPRVEYELTSKGRALLPIVSAMRRFGHAWLVEEPPAGALVAAGR
jgi:DNA-binding HxlR family transcriptional regulator